MHRLWSIPELFQSILRCGGLTEGDFYHMALVSSWFWKVTIPVLWERPPQPDWSLGLGLLLPESQGSALLNWISRKSHQSELPLPDYVNWNLDRFYLHASYIKRLEVDIDDPFLRLLSLRHSTPAFPQLQSLHLSMLNLSDHICMTNILFNDRLQDLTIKTDITTEKAKDALISVLDLAQSASMPLTEFTLGTGNSGASFNSEAEACSRLLSFIEAHTSLRHLTFSGLLHRSQEPFVAASTLPNLTQITEICTQYVMESELQALVPTSCSGFPSLIKFRGDVPLDVIHVALSSIPSENLKELCITSWLEPTSPLADGLRGISRFGALQSFVLSWNGDGAVNWEAIQPILHCPCLQNVELVGPDLSVFIDDERLERMSRAWPALDRLTINDDGDDRLEAVHSPAATFRGLTCFASRCPNLTAIHIAIDARTVPEPTSIEKIGAAVRTISFNCSFINEDMVDPAAAFITKMWPNIKSREWLADLYLAEDFGGEGPDVYGPRWARVWEQVERSLGLMS